jgi:hypothetical protein
VLVCGGLGLTPHIGLYNAFLAPGSPCELNIDHTLRQDMASRMTRAVAKDDAAMYQSLKEVAALFDRAQQQVFKLMAGVSSFSDIPSEEYLTHTVSGLCAQVHPHAEIPGGGRRYHGGRTTKRR